MRSFARKPFCSTGREALALFIGLSNAASRQSKICSQCRYYYLSEPSYPTETSSPSIDLDGKSYPKDDWHNLSPSISSSISRRLHIQKDHPISLTRSIIESQFPSPTYKYHNTFFPVVSTHQNFDSLGFPADHPGRSKSDTYYVNQNTVLRTHTSAHQADVFRANESEGFLISADVYRRDAIDRSHYPIFHQMEGARMWDRTKVPNGDIAAAVWKDLEKLPKHEMKVEDPNPLTHLIRNPLQKEHSLEEAEAIAAHLKRSLELMVVEIFSRAKKAAIASNPEYVDEPLRVRWIEAYFPFTSPSWELEIFWQGDWLEVLGCGVVKQDILGNADVPSQLGWAFGIGLERMAMLLFEIPDIRLFWSRDERFLSQFRGLSENLEGLKRFTPFSKYPACYKDVAFWTTKSEATPKKEIGGVAGDLQCSQDEATLVESLIDPSIQELHENDIMEIVRDIGGDVVEDVVRVDEFKHPKTGRMSLCYRINYRSLERTLRNEEANEYHERIRKALVEKLGVELR